MALSFFSVLGSSRRRPLPHSPVVPVAVNVAIPDRQNHGDPALSAGPRMLPSLYSVVGPMAAIAEAYSRGVLADKHPYRQD